MGGLESFLMQRVDAARRLARTPARAAEAGGRLFVAKRCHEAVKAGEGLEGALERIVDGVVADLDPGAREGAYAEAEAVRRWLARAGSGTRRCRAPRDRAG